MTEQFGVVFESAKARIAGVAEGTTNPTSAVVMINMKRPLCRAMMVDIWCRPTNSADPFKKPSGFRNTDAVLSRFLGKALVVIIGHSFLPSKSLGVLGVSLFLFSKLFVADSIVSPAGVGVLAFLALAPKPITRQVILWKLGAWFWHLAVITGLRSLQHTSRLRHLVSFYNIHINEGHHLVGFCCHRLFLLAV